MRLISGSQTDCESNQNLEIYFIRHVSYQKIHNSKSFHFSAPTCAFEKMQDRSQGESTSCHPIGGGDGYNSLEDCQTATQANKGNAFNWKDGICHYKLCRDVYHWKPTNTKGGWNVYVLKCEGGKRSDIINANTTSNRSHER